MIINDVNSLMRWQVSDILYQLPSAFTSTGTNYIDTGVQFEVGKTYTITCTFYITTFSTTNGTIFGNYDGVTTYYQTLREQVISSGSAAGRYIWGGGFGWADSKNFANTNQIIKWVNTLDLYSTPTRDWYIKNTSSNVSYNGTAATSTGQANGLNFYLGKAQGTGGDGFKGVMSEFTIYNRLLTSAEISAYLA